MTQKNDARMERQGKCFGKNDTQKRPKGKMTSSNKRGELAKDEKKRLEVKRYAETAESKDCVQTNYGNLERTKVLLLSDAQKWMTS